MTEKWYPQRKTIDAPVAILKAFVYYLEHPVSRFTIENDVEKHPEFPKLSFGAITEIITKWGMKPIAYNCELEKLAEIPVPTISLIHETFRGMKMGSLILFFGIDGNEIKYLHPRKGWVYESLKDFSEKWSKAMISLIDIEGNGEIDFVEKEQLYQKKIDENPESSILKYLENFVDADQCEHIIKLANDKFKESQVVGDVDFLKGRTSYTADLPFLNDPVLAKIRLKASKLLKLPESHFEFFQCVSYEDGQEYQNHYDTFDPTTTAGQECLSDGGQRKHTILVYLNDDFEGGQTYFPKLDMLFDPKKGDAVLFDNIDQTGKVIDASWHAGLPVSRGRKYALNMWVREKPIKNL